MVKFAILNPKIYIADVGPLYYRALKRAFREKKCNMIFQNEGGSKAIWKFSDNSSVLVAPPVPYFPEKVFAQLGNDLLQLLQGLHSIYGQQLRLADTSIHGLFVGYSVLQTNNHNSQTRHIGNRDQRKETNGSTHF